MKRVMCSVGVLRSRGAVGRSGTFAIELDPGVDHSLKPRYEVSTHGAETHWFMLQNKIEHERASYRWTVMARRAAT